MAEADRERWDARHAAAPAPVPAPPDALLGREDLLPSAGRALDVACGRGAVALWLAGRGLAVDAVDVSAAALAAGAAAAASGGVGGRVRWWHHDLDAGLPATGSPAAGSPAAGSPAAGSPAAGSYDVVVCQRFRDPALYPALVERLASGGVLVITVLSEVGAAPGAFRAAAGELATAFAGLEVLEHRESGGEAHLLARRP